MINENAILKYYLALKEGRDSSFTESAKDLYKAEMYGVRMTLILLGIDIEEITG